MITKKKKNALKHLSTHANIYLLKELNKGSTITKKAIVFCPVVTAHTLRMGNLFCKCAVVSALCRKCVRWFTAAGLRRGREEA